MFVRIKANIENQSYHYRYTNNLLNRNDSGESKTLPFVIYCHGFAIYTDESIESLGREDRIKFSSQMAKELKTIFKEKNNIRANIVEMVHKSKTITLKEFTKRNQEIFMKIQQEKLMKELINTLRHEITNPVTGIKLAATFMQSKQNSKDSDISEISSEIIKATDKISKLIDPSKKEFNSPMSSIIYPCIKKFQHTHKDVKFIIQIDESIHVRKEIHLFDQIVTNLIANAIESCSVHKDKFIEIKMVSDNAKCELLISDNGPRPIDESRLFSPYYTTKKNGSGLGLFICKKYCDLLDIKIEYKYLDKKYFILSGF